MSNETKHHDPNKLYIDFEGSLDSIFEPLRDIGYVEVGVLGTTKKTAENDVPVAYYGAVHEFGCPEQNIPMRSFLRAPIKKRLPEVLEKHFASIMKKIYQNRQEEVLNDIGNEARNIVLDAFTTRGVEGEWPELTDETIRRKTKKGRKGDAILIDSNDLRLSIDYKVVLKKDIGK